MLSYVIVGTPKRTLCQQPLRERCYAVALVGGKRERHAPLMQGAFAANLFKIFASYNICGDIDLLLFPDIC
jgi:hypothetical protein